MLKTVLAAMCLAGALQAKIVTQDVEYKDGKTVLQGYLAYDDSKEQAPGVLIAHQWMGLTDYEKGRARQLAELGYVAFAADIYGKGVNASSPDEAGKLAGKYKADRKLLRSRMLAGLKALKAQKSVDQSRLAVMGYCFGGTAALELGRAGADLAGIISFHGGLDSPTPADGKNIKGKVLILHGADDPYVPKKDIAALEDELKAAKVDYQMTFYSGAVHAFTLPSAGNDPSKGVAYNAEADRRSWLAMRNFFDEIFNTKKGDDHA
jgi:dienelactone hydrolase